MRALSLRSVTAVLEAPLRKGGQLMDWAYVLLHRPDDCGVAMNSNFFPSYHPQDAKFGLLGRPDLTSENQRSPALVSTCRSLPLHRKDCFVARLRESVSTSTTAQAPSPSSDTSTRTLPRTL